MSKKSITVRLDSDLEKDILEICEKIKRNAPGATVNFGTITRQALKEFVEKEKHIKEKYTKDNVILNNEVTIEVDDGVNAFNDLLLMTANKNVIKSLNGIEKLRDDLKKGNLVFVTENNELFLIGANKKIKW